jgi:hypothetical protein
MVLGDYAIAMAAKKNFNRAAAIVLINIMPLDGCSMTSPIQPASSSKSGFDGAAYKGATVTASSGTPCRNRSRNGTSQAIAMGLVTDRNRALQ